LFARPEALVCLLLISGVCIVRSEPVVPADQRLVVYLKSGANRPGKSIKVFQHELSAIMRSARFRVEWREVGTPPRDVGSATVAVVELRGACSPVGDRVASPLVPESSLASSAISDGRVLPFSWVNCATLTRMLTPALAAQRPSGRDYLYGRAIARVVAHELYHVITNLREHDASGVAKPSFTVDDLMAGHFEFGREATAKLTSQPAR
jgi:hypothetical protein